MALVAATYDVSIERGISFGPIVITVYDDLPPLTTPDAPTVTTSGTAGSDTWTYVVVAKKTSTSQFSAASGDGTTTTGNDTLTTSNYNRITWDSVTYATHYDIYRTVAGTSPTTLGLIGTTSGTSFNDTGIAGDSSTAPTVGGPGVVVDLTGFTPHAHARRDPPDSVVQNLSPLITDYAGGQISIGKFTDEQTLLFHLITRGKWSLVLENSSGDWLPAIVAGSYKVTDSVTRNAPTPIPPPIFPPDPDPGVAYTNIANVFTALNTFAGIRLKIILVGEDYTFTELDWGILVDASGADQITYLPPSTGSGQQYYLQKYDATANIVTLTPDGTDLINDSTSLVLVDQWSDCLLVDAVSGQWILIGGT